MEYLKSICEGRQVTQFTASVEDPSLWDELESLLVNFSLWLIETYQFPKLLINREHYEDVDEDGEVVDVENSVYWYVGYDNGELFVPRPGRQRSVDHQIRGNGFRMTIWIEQPFLKRKFGE